MTSYQLGGAQRTSRSLRWKRARSKAVGGREPSGCDGSSTRSGQRPMCSAAISAMVSREAAPWAQVMVVPVAWVAEAEMMAARAESGIEIALDESLNGAGAARWLGEWPGVLVVKAPLMGDMARLQAQLEPVAERVVLSSVFETGIGFLNTLVLAGALPKLNFALGFDTLQFSDALGGRKEGAVIAASDLVALNPEEIWNANRHLS